MLCEHYPVVIKFNILFFTLPFAGIFYSFASIVIGSTYGALIAFFSTIFMIGYNLLQLERLKIILHSNQISFLKIIFSLNQSLLFFQIIGNIGGIMGFLIGFFYRYLDKFSRFKKKILRLIASIFWFESDIVGNLIRSLGAFVILRIVPDITTKLALFSVISMMFIRKLYTVTVRSIILLIMLKIYDKIVEKN